jgi:PAS domain S-box-containing protein
MKKLRISGIDFAMALDATTLRLFRRLPAIAVLLDQHGQFLEVSDRWADLTGYDAAALAGRRPHELATPESLAVIMEEHLPRLRRHGRLDAVPVEFLARDGRRLPLLVTSVSIREPGAAHLHSISVFSIPADGAREQSVYRGARRAQAQSTTDSDPVNGYRASPIIGSSEPLQALRARINAVAMTSASVLITGEPGSGKALVARAVHALGSRATGPLLHVDCASLPVDGRGLAFLDDAADTSAADARRRPAGPVPGSSTTVLLDEVGRMPGVLQGELLRILERRVASDQADTVHASAIRVMATTSQDLEAEVDARRFSGKLYYRLSIVMVPVPPLRRRGDDVIELAEHFLDRFSRRFGRTRPSLSRQHTDALRAYQWPGNVRELRTVIERAAWLASENVLPRELWLPGAPATALTPGVSLDFVTEAEMHSRQRANILAALQAANWRISGRGGAAELLGVRPTTLSDRLRVLHIRRPARS